jgi:hypothetical protein
VCRLVRIVDGERAGSGFPAVCSRLPCLLQFESFVIFQELLHLCSCVQITSKRTYVISMGFYAEVYDSRGVAVAYGGHPEYIGMNVDQIYLKQVCVTLPSFVCLCVCLFVSSFCLSDMCTFFSCFND